MSLAPASTVPDTTVPDTSVPDTSVLDSAIWSSLTGPHAHLAEGSGQVRRYPSDVSPFVAVSPSADGGVWGELLNLVGPGQVVALAGAPGLLTALPPGWELVMRAEGVQLVSTPAVASAPDDEAVLLGGADVPEMLDLVQRTQPGPFLPRTVEMGTYLGIRRGGRLVAMAGERLHPPGWTEISAVCTDPAFRGEGLARRLVGAVAHGIRARGDVPFLHAAASNTSAIRLYELLGFELRMRPQFGAVRTPGAAGS